jgi:hypothetical protein
VHPAYPRGRVWFAQKIIKPVIHDDVIPAAAGIQTHRASSLHWTPASAGATESVSAAFRLSSPLIA